MILLVGKRYAPQPFDYKTKRTRRLLAIIGVLSLGPHTLAHAALAIDPMPSAPVAGYYAFQKVVYQNDGEFAAVHAQVHNHFSQERHLISKELYR